jgi:hypothetical protein
MGGGVAAGGVDSDGDGLSDIEEMAQGANPFLADTDGDGVNDGDEVNGDPPTDPRRADQGGTGGPTVEVLYPEEGAFILW